MLPNDCIKNKNIRQVKFILKEVGKNKKTLPNWVGLQKRNQTLSQTNKL